MNKLKYFLSTTVVLLCALFSIGQTSISGVIQDADTREPLTGASVQEAGNLVNGTVTDALGNFKITLSGKNNRVLVSYLGYNTQEFSVEPGQNLVLRLSSGVDLQGMVVLADLTRSRGNLSGLAALSSYQLDQAANSPALLDDIAAQVPGLTILKGTTGVGSSSKITIRGENSFNNNNPLVVIDGIPINSTSYIPFTTDAADGFQAIDFGSGLMDLNAHDIESVTVLKGSEAVIYGSRAANGVLLIETKKGSRKQGLGISVQSSVTFDRPFRLPQFQNTYGQGNNGQFAYKNGLGAGVNDNISYSFGPRLDAGLLIPQHDSPVTLPDGTTVRAADVAAHGGLPITPTPFTSKPNNLSDFYELGITTENSLSVESGFDKGSFRLGFSDVRSESIIPGVNYKRQSIAGTMRFKPTDKLSFQSFINYNHASSDNRPASGYGSEALNYGLVAWMPRNIDITAMRDYWQPGFEDIQHYSFNYTFFDNPYFILFENRNALDRDHLFGYLSAKYNLSRRLSLQVRSGMDYNDELRTLRRAYSTNRFKNGGYGEQTVFFREVNSDVLLNYKQPLGNWYMNLSAGANRMNQRVGIDQTQTSALAQPGLFTLRNAATPLEYIGYDGEKRINSVYATADLSFRNLFYINLAARNDWSSALATPLHVDNTSYFYPAVSVQWDVANTLAIPGLSSLRLGVNYAQIGNDTDPYQTSSVFTPATPVGGLPAFTDQSTVPNTNLLPERSNLVEFTGSLQSNNGLLQLGANYYRVETENQIITLPLAGSTGYRARITNGGSMLSQGLEISTILNLSNKVRGIQDWLFTVNFARNRTTVQSLPDEAKRLTLAYASVYDNPNQSVYIIVEEGQRMGTMWGTGYAKNEEGRFIVGTDGRLIADNTLKPLGNYNPDFTMGFINRMKIKNISLGFVLDWRYGGNIISRTLALSAVGGQLKETEFRPEAGLVVDGVVNTGSKEQPVWAENAKAIPAESYYRMFYDRNHEENNMYDASFLKIRELSIGYDFPLRNRKAIENLQLALVGKNLYAFSKIPHFDPEQYAIQGSRFVSGVEDMSYPTTRSIGLSLKASF